MKNLYSLLLAAALSVSAAAAQVVTVTGGTQISALSPINHGSSEGAFEVIYLQPSINQAGLITRLAFEKSDGTELLPLTGVVIYLKTTTLTQFQNGLLDTLGYQRVYAGNFPNATPAGYQQVLLQTPFAYANAATQNLSVLVLRNGGNVQATIGPRARYLYGVTMTPVRIACRRYTGNAPVTATTALTATNILPNLRLTFGTPTAARSAATGNAGAWLFPQPAATDAVALDLDARLWPGPLTYSLTDAVGRVVRPVTLLPTSGAATHLLPLKGLPAGRYYLHLAGSTRRTALPLLRE